MSTDKPLLLECGLLEKWRNSAKTLKSETEYDEGASLTYAICAHDLESWLAEREAIWKEVVIEHRYVRDGGYSGCRCTKVQFSGQSWDEDWLAWIKHVESAALSKLQGATRREDK